ncbi:precorrin-2/cobalt-factor-2 C20-methyltransferase [Dehalogenimonas formicexedens]|uniref:Precorrin-2/cobalt-factor-2 C20-methyltransferase n=1 Tax=Dehalogenimonas formicexedens TaxID=1839801 RepID=A0A1P8F9F9_9CHLR|nr:precorrin-2 C(20)-methyltransferase [Dehalogenimonas formicexedens]APV45099.1 precorrin-2/cobalt-factor-2 C20-methyltransferase [Dehalogenimonas formicexedens]
MAQGKLYGIGVGPGDPELVTIKALRLLREVPAIFAPCKAAGEPSLASRIVCQLDERLSPKIANLVFPMSDDEAELDAAWQAAARSVAEKLNSGIDCAFIVEGDPFLFGSFIYLFDKFAGDSNQPIEVVPGVSSITAAPARAGIPLVRGDERLAVVPAPSDREAIRRVLSEFESVVFMKINPVFDTLVGVLEEMSLLDRATVVVKATTSEERIIRRLADLKGQKPGYFSIMMVRR